MLKNDLRQLIYIHLCVTHNIYVAESARSSLLHKQRIHNKGITAVFIESVGTAFIVLARIYHPVAAEFTVAELFSAVYRFLVVPVDDFDLRTVVRLILRFVLFHVSGTTRNAFGIFPQKFRIHQIQPFTVNKRHIEKVCTLLNILYARLPEQIQNICVSYRYIPHTAVSVRVPYNSRTHTAVLEFVPPAVAVQLFVTTAFKYRRKYQR